MELKTYLVRSEHEVYMNDFTKNDDKYVNGYSLEGIVEAVSPKEAIKEYIKEHLCYKFDEKKIAQDEDCIYYNATVDVNNEEAEDKDSFELWVMGEMTLYTNHITLEVFKLEKQIFD